MLTVVVKGWVRRFVHTVAHFTFHGSQRAGKEPQCLSMDVSEKRCSRGPSSPSVGAAAECAPSAPDRVGEGALRLGGQPGRVCGQRPGLWALPPARLQGLLLPSVTTALCQSGWRWQCCRGAGTLHVFQGSCGLWRGLVHFKTGTMAALRTTRLPEGQTSPGALGASSWMGRVGLALGIKSSGGLEPELANGVTHWMW